MQTLVPIDAFEAKKTDQENLTDAQKTHLKKHVDAIIDEFG